MHKKIIGLAMMLLVVILTGCSSQASSQNENPITSPSAQAEEKTNTETEVSKVEKVEVVYFHSSRRCVACQYMQQFTDTVIQEHFPSQIRDGKVSFQSINVEEPENKEIVQKYQARGSSLFINVIKDGQDNIAEEVQAWRLLGNEPVFKQYLKQKIDNYLK